MSGDLDTRAAMEAVGGPGADTRVWLCTAVVTEVHLDPDHGLFVELTLLPSGNQETAMVGAMYAGPRFGFYLPVAVNDNVLVAYPNGDPNEGLVVVCILHSASHKPPEVEGAEKEVLLCCEPEKQFRIKTSGSGPIKLVVEGDGDIEIKSDSGTLKLQGATEAFVKGDVFKQALTTFLGAWLTFLSILVAFVAGVGAYAVAVAAVLPLTAPANGVLQPLVGAVASAFATYQLSHNQFVSTMNNWLSTRIKGS